MTKNDFLDKLRHALSGKVSPSLVQENMTYYSEYIDSQISMGRSEQEVMDILGDPRLIARTIVQTNGTETNDAQTADESSYRENVSHDDSSYGSAEYDHLYNQDGYSGRGYYEHYQGRANELKIRTIPGWLWTIIVVVIVICLISFVFSVVSFLLPFVLPVLIVMFLVKLFRDWLN